MSTPLTRLRLDLEMPETGLYNLITNPTGVGGSVAGWVTPVSGATLKATNTTAGPDDHGVAGWKLIYNANGGGTDYFHSLPFPVTPGWFINARWKAPYVDGFYGQSIEFLAADKTTVVTSGRATHSRSASGSLRTVAGAIPIPAGAAFARIVFQMRANEWFSGGPSAGQDLIIQDVEVATAATAAALGTSRVNWITDGGGEDGASHNVGAVSANITRVTTTPRTGSGCWQITAAFGGGAAVGMSSAFDNQTLPTAGTPVTVSAHLRPLSTVRQFRHELIYNHGASSNLVAQSPLFNETAGVYAQGLHTFTTLPAGAVITAHRVMVVGSAIPNGEAHLVDDIQMLVGSASIGTLFNHRTADLDGITYEVYRGSSASSFLGAFEHTFTAAIAPRSTFWQDVTGAHAEAKIVRRPLDAGTLTTVLKPNQLPAGCDPKVIPGNGYRVRLDANPLITTTISTRQPKEAKAAQIPPIQVAAADAGKVLAAAPKNTGVGALAHLAWTLEDTGVPWLINGSSAQVATPPATASNPNTKAIDQIAMTRDLNLPAYAWINRDGFAVINSLANLSGTVKATLDEDDLSYFEQGYDLSGCINIVTVKVYGTGVTTYGPFKNQASIDQWGEQPCTLTLQGSSVTSTVAQTVAQALLTANAQPTFQVVAVTVPITRNAQDAIALLDLYDLIRVQHAASGTNQLLRVTEIVHEISVRRWLMRLRLSVPGLAAIPQVIPEP